MSARDKLCSVWVRPIRVSRGRPHSLTELAERHEALRPLIRSRIDEFRGRWQLGEDTVFAEMCFCLLTPQSSALRGMNAVCRLEAQELLKAGTMDEIEDTLASAGVRFADSKASYIVRNRETFLEGGKETLVEVLLLEGPDIKDVRRRVRDKVLGFGLKEATHFLRNIGLALGSEVAILDRHVQSELIGFGYLESAPKNLSSEKNYGFCEEAMSRLSRDSRIPTDELDLLLWANRTGIILK